MACQRTALVLNWESEVTITIHRITCRYYHTGVLIDANHVHSPGFRPNLSFPESGEVCEGLKLHLEPTLILAAV